MSTLTSPSPQVPTSHQACKAGTGESSALLGGPTPRRWHPQCWVGTGYWVSPMPDTVTLPPEPPGWWGRCPWAPPLPWGRCFGGQSLKVTSHSQHRASTAVWLCLGYPVLVLAHALVCVTAWLLIVLIPVAKLSARAAFRVLLLPPERVLIWRLKMVGDSGQGEGPTPCSRGNFGVGSDPLVPLQTEVPLEGEVILCCYRATNPYYYKYAVDGINVFAVSILLGAGVDRKSVV